MIEIAFKKLDHRAIEPRNAYGNDAGWDLFALNTTMIPAGVPIDVRTGLAVAIPDGYYGRIVHRSSAPRKKGIMVLEGIIDAGFRGELFACAFAWTTATDNITGLTEFLNPKIVEAGESICQIIVQKVEQISWVDFGPVELPSSLRGEKGFGSSGA